MPGQESLWKECPDCRQVRSVHDYSANASRSDGLQFYCKSCYSRRSAIAYRRRQERVGKSVRERPDVPPGHKFCPGCRQTRPAADWHRNRTTKDGLAAHCKTCRAQQSKTSHLRRTFGLTVDEREALLDRQNGVCAVCGAADPGHVDHDHATGRVRGVLCARCNLGLGQFKDDPLLLRRAARYLSDRAVADTVGERSPAEVIFLDYLETHRAG